MTARPEISIHGPVFRQFKNKPKEAIVHLMKVKEGEAIAALYRKEVGFIDLIWGQNNKENTGFGLKHIVEKHGKKIKLMGFNIETFISDAISKGKFKETEPKKNKKSRKVFENKWFRFVVEFDFYGEEKTWLLTAFDLKENPD